MLSSTEMVSNLECAVGAASAILRLSSYFFLQWIPGHHFPPIILIATAVYLTLIFAYRSDFGLSRPSLRYAFPRAFEKPRRTVLSKDETVANGPSTTQYEEVVEPSVYGDEKAIFKTLLFGIPDRSEKEYSYLTVFVNILLALFTLDMVFRSPLLYPSNELRFSRVGYVDATFAKVLVREPDPANLPLYVYYKRFDQSSWDVADTIYWLADDTDYTYPVTISGLQPETTYAYSMSNDLAGSFTTTPQPGDPKAMSLTFLTTSCIKANFPYDLLSNSLVIPGFKHLSRTIRSLASPPSFMLFLGDFIYVDVPLRLSSSLHHYRAEYRRVYASPSWKLPGLSIPWLHTLDDHEIANDWASGNTTEPFPAASDPFIHYHVSVNPPVPPSARGLGTNTTFFQFNNGPASFFMLDTRRYRTMPEGSNPRSSLSPSSDTESAHSMLGQQQLTCLLKYLRSPEPPHIHWKIIASSVPFTKNWRFGTSDTWGGFLKERAAILNAMHYAERSLGVRVVILSGDRHEFAAIRYPPPDTAAAATDQKDDHQRSPTGPHEFSVGPLSMFYLPFRTFKQVDEQDVAIAYFPDGNSKVGVINIHPTRKRHSMLKYSLWIDGKVKWEYAMTSPAEGFDGRRDWFGIGSFWT